jgi:hypothetical protein
VEQRPNGRTDQSSEHSQTSQVWSSRAKASARAFAAIVGPSAIGFEAEPSPTRNDRNPTEHPESRIEAPIDSAVLEFVPYANSLLIYPRHRKPGSGRAPRNGVWLPSEHQPPLKLADKPETGPAQTHPTRALHMPSANFDGPRPKKGGRELTRTAMMREKRSKQKEAYSR